MVIGKPIRGITPGAFRQIFQQHRDFAYFGFDMISLVCPGPLTSTLRSLTFTYPPQVSVLPEVRVEFQLADPAAVKVGTSHALACSGSSEVIIRR